MEPETLIQLQVLFKDALEASESGAISSITLFKKYVAKINSIWKQCGGGQTVSDHVREWVETGQGIFYSSQMFAELGFITRQDKKAADMALRRLVEKGTLAECGEKRGCWRKVVDGIEQIDWQSAQPDDTIPLLWPLELEQYFTLYPTNVIVVAGEKNSGKTSFMLNLVYLNALTSPLPVDYFSSEMAAQELAVRVKGFPDDIAFKATRWWPLDSDTIADVINPDSINIIDYLEVEDEFWKVAKTIKHVWKKLKKGIVVLAIQKDADSKYGRGKAFSSEKARVYVTMSKQQNMTMTEIKNYKGDKKPDGMVIPYLIANGGPMERRPVPPKPKKIGTPGTYNVRTLRPEP